MSARVVESLDLYVSNSSVNQYQQSRNAVGQDLSTWQKILYTTTLTEHILNQRSGVQDFQFLPSALTTANNGGTAVLTMEYTVSNITSMKIIAPRTLEYSFNNSVFNFEHTGSGQQLPPNTRLNIIVPSGASIINAYPIPDYPSLNLISNYNNDTLFSWYSQEQLSSFSFVYVTKETLQKEVESYFSGVYSKYSLLIYVLIVLCAVLLAIYIYIKLSQA